MIKYKVGDKVKIISKNKYGGWAVGSIVVLDKRNTAYPDAWYCKKRRMS
jgi:hypothetical protein